MECACSFVVLNGLAAVVVTDKEYPERVAFSLLGKVIVEFESEFGQAWRDVAQDQNLEPLFLKEALNEFQDPRKADKLVAIQEDLSEITQVMRQNLEELVSRGESLDSLMAKSEDLSHRSSELHRKAKKQNACCKSF